MTKPPVSLISFDLDNTLWPTKTVIRRAERALQSWLKQQHPEAWEQQLQPPNFLALREQLVSHKPHLKHKPTALRLQVLAMGFRQAGYAEPHAQQAAEAGFAHFIAVRNQVSFFPQAIEVLQQLSRHFRLVAITNGNADLQRIGLGHMFAQQYTAEQVGYTKPDARIFQHMLADQHLRAEQCIHIGDHPEEDIAAAQACGLHTVWANVIQAPWPQHLPKPVYTVQHLHQLPSIINENFTPHESTS